MATNLGIDDKLLNEAVVIGGHQTKKSAVNAALEEYIQRRKQLEIFNIFGTVDYDDDYDYKKQRHKKRGAK